MECVVPREDNMVQNSKSQINLPLLTNQFQLRSLPGEKPRLSDVKDHVRQGQQVQVLSTTAVQRRSLAHAFHTSFLQNRSDRHVGLIVFGLNTELMIKNRFYADKQSRTKNVARGSITPDRMTRDHYCTRTWSSTLTKVPVCN